MTEQPKLEELRKIEKWAKEHGYFEDGLNNLITFVEVLEIQQSEEYQLGNAAANALFEMFPTRAFALYQDDLVKLGKRIKHRTTGEVWESIYDVPKNKVVYDREGDMWRYIDSRQEWQVNTVKTSPASNYFRVVENPNSFKPFTDQKNAPA